MKHVYIETILLIERLHRLFLDVIKTELDRMKVEDINNIQTLIMYNIGDVELTVGELTGRGYYLGSNVSYNVKKLVENGYLIQERSMHDKRSVRVRLSEKGLAICHKIDELYHTHVAKLQEEYPELVPLAEMNKVLLQMERFWTGCVTSVYKPSSAA